MKEEKKMVPKLRFPGFGGEWEDRKLGETKTYFTDGNYGEMYPKTSDMTDSNNGVPFLTGGNLKNGQLDVTGANYITEEKHQKLTSGHLIEDDIVIAVRGSLGALGYVNKRNVAWLGSPFYFSLGGCNVVFAVEAVSHSAQSEASYLIA